VAALTGVEVAEEAPTHTASQIRHEVSAQCETDSGPGFWKIIGGCSSRFGIRENSAIPGRTDIENAQGAQRASWR